jgi:hypothetical protein
MSQIGQHQCDRSWLFTEDIPKQFAWKFDPQQLQFIILLAEDA